MYLNLSFYFNLYAIFKSIYALYHLHVVIASPLHSHHSVQVLFHSFPFPNHTHHFRSNLSTKSLHFRPFVQSPSPFCYSQTTCYQQTLRSILPHNFSHKHKIVFPSTFFSLYPSNHTNQIAATITQIVVHLLQLYNPRHFHFNHHSFFQPSPTFSPLLFPFTPLLLFIIY